MKTKKLFFLLVLLVFINKPILAQVNADVYTTYLFYTCKVWGYLKYFHSSLADGKINWDDLLINNLPKLNGINSKEAFNDYLGLYFNMLSPMPSPSEPKPVIASELRFNLDTNWFYNTNFDSNTVNFLKDIENKFRPKNNYYVSIEGANLKFTNDLQYSWVLTTTKELRLLGLFRYWNTINYFYPYKNIIDKNWDDVLAEFIPKIVNVEDEISYNMVIMELATRINDAHARTSSSVINNEILGLYYLPVKLKSIQGKIVVSDVCKGYINVKRGDLVKSINGTAIDIYMKKFLPIIYGSNSASFERNLCRQLVRFKDQSTVIIEIENENGIKKVSLSPLSETAYYSLFSKTYALTTIERNDKKIGLVNMGVLLVEQVPLLFDELWTYDAVVFDIRNYPQNTMWYMINYLFPAPIMIARATVPDVKYPGTIYWVADSVGTGDFSKNYQKRIYLLFNEETQSAAEYTIMALEQHPKAVKIGSQTAGADGNVSRVYLPGGIGSTFTGLGIFYPDYRPTQRVGIVPDIEVKPTIAGIREGKDEVLEAALNHFLVTDVVEENSKIPSVYSISQNFPNPFNPSTKIEYQIPKTEYVSIKVFDLLGKVVAVLENQIKLPGKYSVQFEASKYSLSTGVYFYNITTQNYSKTMKMLLVK